MCQQIRCPDCGKPTWTGCGRHIETALANVPKDARCTCRETAKKDGSNAKRKLFGLF